MGAKVFQGEGTAWRRRKLKWFRRDPAALRKFVGAHPISPIFHVRSSAPSCPDAPGGNIDLPWDASLRLARQMLHVLLHIQAAVIQYRIVVSSSSVTSSDIVGHPSLWSAAMSHFGAWIIGRVDERHDGSQCSRPARQLFPSTGARSHSRVARGRPAHRFSIAYLAAAPRNRYCRSLRHNPSHPTKLPRQQT